MRQLISAAVGLVLALGLAAPAQAVSIDWVIKLDGSQEEPEPVITGGIATAHLQYDTETNLFDIDIFVHGLTTDDLVTLEAFAFGDDFIPFHLHIEDDNPPTDQTGPIQVIFGTNSDWTDDTPGIGMHLSLQDVPWLAEDAEALEAQLLNGEGYLNLHTNAFPGGEIRGDIPAVTVVPEPASLAFLGLSLAGLAALRRN